MSDEEIGRVFDDNYVARTKLRRFHVMMDEAIALYETLKGIERPRDGQRNRRASPIAQGDSA